MRPHEKLGITYVQYQGSIIAIPEELTGRTIYSYAEQIETERLDCKGILWNGKLHRITLTQKMMVEF